MACPVFRAKDNTTDGVSEKWQTTSIESVPKSLAVGFDTTEPGALGITSRIPQ